jgi:uncharacterized protein (DUF1778 family)
MDDIVTSLKLINEDTFMIDREYKMLQIRLLPETHKMLDRAAYFGKTSMNKIINEAIDTRKTFIEKKYLKDVDNK